MRLDENNGQSAIRVAAAKGAKRHDEQRTRSTSGRSQQWPRLGRSCLARFDKVAPNRVGPERAAAYKECLAVMGGSRGQRRRSRRIF